MNGHIGRNFELIAALTLLDTRTDYLDAVRRLPLRPPLTAYVRPVLSAFELGPLSRIDGWIDVGYVAESYVQPANDPGGLLPERVRIGAGISGYVWENRLRLDVAVQDLLDQRGTDLLGFPLPGRSLQIALSVSNQ